MSKTLIIEAMVRDGNGMITKAAAARAVDSFARAARENLAATGRFSVPGLGSLAVKQASAREGRNPRTGAKVTTPARKKVKFTESSELRSFATECVVAT
jgi:DNA-binding protein HU-beta